MYRTRILQLTESHRVLDEKIIKQEKENPHFDVTEWKKQKLALKDEIRRLEKLQWEHERESVDFDDDR